MKAWAVTLLDVESIVLAPTRSAARAAAILAARDAGYRVDFGDPCRAVRAAEFDASKLLPRRCFARDYVESLAMPAGGTGGHQ